MAMFARHAVNRETKGKCRLSIKLKPCTTYSVQQAVEIDSWLEPNKSETHSVWKRRQNQTKHADRVKFRIDCFTLLAGI